MLEIIIAWILYSVAILISSYLLPGIHVDSFGTALITAVVLGVLNAFLKPLLVLLTLPINILTLGLFTLIINTLLIMLTASVVGGFTVDSFWWGLLFSVILSLISSIFTIETKTN